MTHVNIFNSPHCRSQMNIWKVWHLDYGVIYDAEMKKGKYEWEDKEAIAKESNGRVWKLYHGVY